MHSPLDLSPAEHLLMQALVAGASNKAMAQQLGKSEFTIRNQLSRLFRKVNASNRTQAVNWWHINKAVAR